MKGIGIEDGAGLFASMYELIEGEATV